MELAWLAMAGLALSAREARPMVGVLVAAWVLTYAAIGLARFDLFGFQWSAVLDVWALGLALTLAAGRRELRRTWWAWLVVAGFGLSLALQAAMWAAAARGLWFGQAMFIAGRALFTGQMMAACIPAACQARRRWKQRRAGVALRH